MEPTTRERGCVTVTIDSSAARDQPDVSVPERFIQAATRLFAEQDFPTTSVQEIVNAVGLTKGAFYHYFSSKDDLLHEIYARLLRLQQEHLDVIMGLELPPDERLRRVAVDVVTTTLENLDAARVFFRSYHLLPDDKRVAIRASRREYGETLARLIEEGISAGVLSADAMPADIRLYHFIGAVSWATIWYQPGGAYGVSDIANWYANDLLDSLRPR